MNFTKYKITGTLRDGRRFKPIFGTNYDYISRFNVYRGTLWGYDGTKWKKIREYYN